MITFEAVKAHDSTAIRVARFEPPTKAIGVVQIIHGFGEGLAHYKEIATFFANSGYVCIVHDQRGFGEMPDMEPKQRQKARGIMPGYEYLLEDIKTLYQKINQWYPGLPVILYGHSMGGNIAINYLLKHSEHNMAILEAPWLRLYKPLPKLANSLARLIGKASSNVAISANINIDAISRDREVTNSRRTDGIYHTRMSLRLYSQVVEAGEYAIENAARISIPTLLLCPGGDTIVCPNAIREFAKGCDKNLVFVEYPEAYHCLHADINNAEVMAAMLDFCNERVGE